MVSEIAPLNVVKTPDNPRPVLLILDAVKPFVKEICRFNVVFHANIVAYNRHTVKAVFLLNKHSV